MKTERQKRHTTNPTNQIHLLQELAIYELVETHGPLCFLIVFTMAYFTPVGVLVGNISNGYWAFQAIDDISFTLTRMAMFFVVDFISTLASGSILWFACKINFWTVLVQLQKEFVIAFILSLGKITQGVSLHSNS